MFCCLTCIYPTIYTHSLVYSPYVCEDIVLGNGNVLNSHCEWNGSVAGNIIKTHWLGGLNRFSSSVVVGINTGETGEKHWGILFVRTLSLSRQLRESICYCTVVSICLLLTLGVVASGRGSVRHKVYSYVKQYIPKGSDVEPVLPVHIHAYFMLRLFILRIWQLCSVYRDLEMWGSTRATTWRSAAVQPEGSHTPRPTTGCFWVNKDFLLSTEVPTDAFIGAKFTLCARRELPLCCSEWRCSSPAAYSCLSCSWASQNKVSQPQQGPPCALTSAVSGSVSACE